MAQIPTIGIVWRNDPINDECKRGNSAFWDHYTLQTLLNVPTYIIPWNKAHEECIRDTFRLYLEKHSKDIPIKEEIDERSSVDDLKDELKRHGLNVSVGHKAELWKRLMKGKAKLPHTPEVDGLRLPEFRSADEVDIIVIPDVARGEHDKYREAFEKNLLQTYAFSLKRFILLCGGVWRLEVFGVKIGPSKDHSCSKMISLNPSGEINYNVDVHYVKIQQCATAKRIWPNGLPEDFPVNSVHPESIIELGPRMESKLEVVAISTQKCKELKNRQEKVMEPIKCIEVVASKDPEDFPLVAIQWQPEAYCHDGDSVHKALLDFVVKAQAPVVPAPSCMGTEEELADLPSCKGTGEVFVDLPSCKGTGEVFVDILYKEHFEGWPFGKHPVWES